MAFSMSVVDTADVKQEVAEEVKVEPEAVTKLKKQAEDNAIAIMNVNMDALPDKNNILQAMDGFGEASIQKSTEKNELLKTTVGDLSKSGAEGSLVSKSLTDLHEQLEALDPSSIDFTRSGFLGKIFNPVRSYFEKFERSDDVIADILESLEKGRDMLKNDNTTLQIEEQDLRDITKRIAQEIEMGTYMDDALQQKVNEAKAQNMDADKVRFVEEEILFPLRQRVMDMQQMTVVNQQGIIAMEVIRRNNLELIRGVDRAKTVTVSALRTAVIVASALYNQKIVLNKIQMLNQTTDNLISATSKMLKEQGAEIQKESMQSSVSVDTLKQSFTDVMSALDSISEYKQQALPVMRDTINQFRELADQGEKQISKLERGSAINHE